MRIYDADIVELHNASYVMRNSKVYVISGNNLSEIIDGQSVIVGDILELREELDYALAPNVQIVYGNLPLIFSSYDNIGMKLGKGIKVCPALNVIATSKIEITGNYINTTAQIPGNNTLSNGTITILEDTLYLYGTWNTTWVNITYTSNGTLYQNTTYIPHKIDITGQNLTINASNDITLIRETQYNQYKKFYWTYHEDKGYGSTPTRNGWHTATETISNPLGVTIDPVYVFFEFWNGTKADENTVIVEYVNTSRILTRGEHYKTSGTAVEFQLRNGLGAGNSKTYKISYYEELYDTFEYGEDMITITSYDEEKWLNNRSYFYFDFTWKNNLDTTFRGGLYIKLDFKDAEDIDPNTFVVWDRDNNHEVNDAIYGNGYFRIGASSIGDTLPGYGRHYGIYFLFDEYPGAKPMDYTMSTPLGTFGITWTWGLIFYAIASGLMMIGLVGSYFSKTWNKWKQGTGYKLFILMGFLMMFLVFIIQAKTI
jgi:hypothetical protein